MESSGLVHHHELTLGARALKGIGAPAARRVAAAADARAANPLESVLRALCLDIPGLVVVPQFQIVADGIWAAVDLADPDVGLVLEAEGFEFHGNRRGLIRDSRRYSEIAVLGWAILRFTWDDVMFHPDWVRWAIVAWLAQRHGLPVPPAPEKHQTPA